MHARGIKLDIYKDCKIKEGKGNKDGELMIIYEGPEFDSKNKIQKLAKEVGISGRNIYVTPLKKGFPKGVSKQEVTDRLVAEIAEVNPRLIWTVGDFPLEVMDIKIPVKFGYGLYFPFLQEDFLVFILPDSKQINKMPSKIRKEFWSRIQRFKREWEGEDKTAMRRADKRYIHNFVSKKGYEFDKKLSSPKTYFVLYSNEIEAHVFVLPNKTAREDFKEIPFGLKFTQEEVGRMDKNTRNLIAKLMKKYGGDIVKVNEEIIKRRTK